MSVEEKQEARKQWSLWEYEKFGGLPMEVILGNHSKETKNTKSKDGLFLICKYVIKDEQIEVTKGDPPYFLLIDEKIENEARLIYVGVDEEPDINYYRECESYQYCSGIKRDYEITEQFVSVFLEKLPIRKELNGKENVLTKLICCFLNRDNKRMNEALIYDSDYKRKTLLKDSLLDRASTIAIIEALYSTGVVSPLEQENSIAGQESATERATETQSIEPPIEIQELFKPYLEEGELVLTAEPINGTKRYLINTNRSANSFFKHAKEREAKDHLLKIPATTMAVWIYNNKTRESYTSVNSFLR